MLPGNIPALLGGKPPVTYGVDAFTKSLMKFDGVYGAALAGNALTDYVKPSRVWASGGGAQANNGICFPGQAAFSDGSKIYSPTNETDYAIVAGQDFTIDFWMFPTNTADGQVLSKYSGTYSPYVFYQVPGGTSLAFYASSGSSWDIASNVAAGATPLNTWSHHAVQRKGNVWSTWANGVQQATWTTGTNPLTSTDPVCFGNNFLAGGNPWTGYIDEARWSSVARYPSTPTVQTFPYYGALSGSNDAATKLLLHMESLVDSAAGPTLKTPHVISANGGATLVSTQAKFGANSLQLTGATNNRLSAADPGWDLNPYLSDFTIDFWYYRTGTAPGYLAAKTDAQTFPGWVVYDGGSGAIQLFSSSNNSSWNVASALTMGTAPLNIWTHLAAVRKGGTFYTFNNGALVTTLGGVGVALFPNSLPVSVGNLSGAAAGPTGFIDEVRFSDVARWTASFALATAPYA